MNTLTLYPLCLQLEYVRLCISYYTKNPNSFPFHVYATFINRYNQGLIDTSFQSEYLNCFPLLAQLYGYNIHFIKFYYLILFLKDFIDSLKFDVKNSAVKDLEEIARLIEQSESTTITIQASIPKPNGTGKPHKYTFASPPLLRALPQIIKEALPHLQQIPDFTSPILLDNANPAKQAETATFKQYLLHHYVEQVLSTFKASNEKEYFITIPPLKMPIQISYDKNLIISRIVGIIGYFAQSTQRSKKAADKENSEKKAKYLQINKTENLNRENELMSNISKYRQNPPNFRFISKIYEQAIGNE